MSEPEAPRSVAEQRRRAAGYPLGGRARCADAPPAELRRGVEEFNHGQFYAQHETLEALWRAASDEVRYLYQGVLLVGVGCYHLQRGNYHGAVRKLGSGIELLRWFTPVCQGIDVARLLADAERLLAAIRAGGPDGVQAVDSALWPKVQFVTAED